MNFDSTTISKSILDSSATPQVRVVHRTKVQGYYIPRLDQEVVPIVRSSKENAGYVYYTIAATVDSNSLSTSFDLEVGDSKVEYITTGSLLNKVCSSL